MDTSYCKELLSREFDRRRYRNPMYSLRAFSRDLGIGSTSLSDLLACKRKLSRKNLQKIAKKLALSPKEESALLLEGKGTKKPTIAEIETIQLAEDTFRLISEWHYMAILNLTKIKNNKADSKWIANRLGITESDTESALERLQRMKVIEIKDHQLVRTSLPLSTTRDIPSSAIKKYHHETLDLAHDALDKIDIKLREFSTITMAIDLNQLEKAKNILMSTKRKIAELLETGNPTEIYTLSFQLFPLTKIDVEK